MPLVVATALADTPDGLYERARLAAEHADWVEVRLDGPSGLPWDLRAFFAHPKPCLATVRAAEDGGRSHADDATRADVLRRALRAGARGVDVELWSDEARALAKEARDAGAMVVLSRHFLDGTPSFDELLATLREARAAGADVAKVATLLQAPEDAVRLVRAARAAREDGIPYALMAVNDPVLRLMAGELGMALVYAAVPGQPAAAPGQVPAPELRRALAAAPAPRAPTAATRRAYVLGHPVAHSLSPRMHNAAFAALGLDACYLALDVPPERLAEALAGLRASPPLGANLTIPHKVAVLPLLDALSEDARAAGSVNTLVFRDGRVEGHNTDGAGALDALREHGTRVQGARALVLGAGGAARGVAHALARAGAQVTLANRTAAKADEAARDLGLTTIPFDRVPDAMRAVDLLVNATSVGLRDDALPVPLAGLLPTATVIDCVYRPGGTALVREARARGCVAVPGESMLLHQGARAFALWTGRPAPVEAMRHALEAPA